MKYIETGKTRGHSPLNRDLPTRGIPTQSETSYSAGPVGEGIEKEGLTEMICQHPPDFRAVLFRRGGLTEKTEGGRGNKLGCRGTNGL